MATIKVACPKCGQKVSGDESFFGSSVECPICSASILFPEVKKDVEPHKAEGESGPDPVRPNEPVAGSSENDSHNLPVGFTDEVVPQAPQSEPEPEDELEDLEEEFELEVVPSPVFGAISMVAAVLGVVTCAGGILFAPIAIIFGHTAGAKARHSPVHPAPGQTLGAIGMLIGYVNLVFLILGLTVAVFFKEPIRTLLERLGQ